MALVTNFERDSNGRYLSIEQRFSDEIPEGSTFVGFDSVKFAHATGQVAITQINVNFVGNASVTGVDNRDNRWVMWAMISDENTLDVRYFGLGPTIEKALKQRGVKDPRLNAEELLVVKQFIDKVDGTDFIGDGPMELNSESRYDEGMLPIPFTDVSITPKGGLLSSVIANLDPSEWV